ncbi:rho-related GTP-binding protein RhoG [Folsomia candida]|uniref:Rho-related GTP-binding protein RhoG n=1 Tax=Folsomia candida TaxID=158441 RepID=A0A226E1Q1_FOLCA|nr:rho-related GTP-binding protein RhoG [Folsomia candida]OXA51675.1 Rho-related GTP-binding protein RhoG [Folsomia candida]
MKELDTFVKIVVIGDSNVGKTWFLSTFVNNHKLPEKCEPTLFDNLSTQFVFHGIEYELSLWDTSGAPERKKLRCLSYQDADVFIMCYSIDNRSSYDNIRFRWLKELRRRCPGVPRILVGLKSDLRSKLTYPLLPKDGEILQFDIQASAFFEFSITTPKKHADIFAEAVRLALLKKVHVRRQSCCMQ